MSTKMSNWELIKNGIFTENTIFRMAISLCPAIAVTNSLKNGFFMGVAVIFVQVMVNLTVSMIKGVVNSKIRIPVFMLVISGWVSVVDMLMAAYVREVYLEVGLYIQLIVAFASILARAETFAFKNKVSSSFFDGLGMGIGFMVALVIISFVREVLGKGMVWGYPLVDFKPLLVMILPAGGFFATGILMGFFNWIETRFYGAKASSGH